MFALSALLWSTIAPAWGGTAVLAASAGRDFPTAQYWTGLDLSLHPDGERGWAPMGRVAPGWGFADEFGLLHLEAGVTWVIPREGKQELVRLGAVASALGAAPVDRDLPLEFTETEQGRHLGIVPGIEALVEFEYPGERPFVFGVRGGIQSVSSNYLCDQPDEVEGCLTWTPGFMGGFYGRGPVLDWLYLEALIGPSPRLTVGYPF